MTTPDRRIKLKIDIQNGTIELDASAEDFDNAMERTTSLAKEVRLASHFHRPEPRGNGEAIPPTPSQVAPEVERSRPKRRGNGTSAARPGRLGSFEMVNLNLNESQERSLREFMAAKKPNEQREQVAVAMYKGEEILGRKGLSYNEIYTLMRLSGVKELPKALDVVIGAMASDMWVVRDGAGYSMKFVGRDHVENKLGMSEE